MSEGRFIEDTAQVVAGTASAGGGFFFVRWVWGQITGRLDRKQAYQDAQDLRLDAEWKQMREEMKADMAVIKRQCEGLRVAFHHVAAALIKVDPGNPALVQAEKLLNQAFPIDFQMLADRAGAALDLEDERRRG